MALVALNYFTVLICIFVKVAKYRIRKMLSSFITSNKLNEQNGSVAESSERAPRKSLRFESWVQRYSVCSVGY